MQTENTKKILAENQDILIGLNTKLGLMIKAADVRSFQTLVRAVSGIVDTRQGELMRSLNYEYTDSHE